jgi:hypothetical protein
VSDVAGTRPAERPLPRPEAPERPGRRMPRPAPVPLARIAVFRTIAYLFIPVDVFLTTAWVRAHAAVPTEYYQPLLIGEILPLPTPTATVVHVVQWALVLTALVAATGRAPRVLGTAVFLLYFQWMVIAMSYGKVDHDRFAFLVALAVLPTVGRARWRDRRLAESAGWAMGAVFLAVMLTYFLAAWAKVRFGGWDWVTGSTLTWAVLRRGTDLATWTLEVPALLTAAQWAMVILELAAPLMLLVRSDRARVALVVFLLGFHLMVFAGVRIIFLPHCVAILSMLPWERLPDVTSRLSPRAGARRPAGVVPAGAAPPG